MSEKTGGVAKSHHYIRRRTLSVTRCPELEPAPNRRVTSWGLFSCSLAFVGFAVRKQKQIHHLAEHQAITPGSSVVVDLCDTQRESAFSAQKFKLVLKVVELSLSRASYRRWKGRCKWRVATELESVFTGIAEVTEVLVKARVEILHFRKCCDSGCTDPKILSNFQELGTLWQSKAYKLWCKEQTSTKQRIT